MRSAHVKSVSSLGALVALAAFSLALLAPAVASAWSGQLIWARGVEMGLDDEGFADLARGPGGSVYAVGWANYAAGNGDLLVAKFSAAGKPLWRRVYGGLAHGDDSGRAIAVDAAGNAYVTGSSASLVNGSDAITLKYSSSGTRLWTKRYNGMADDFDEGVDVALDGAGRAYVAMTSSVMGGKNIVVVKYGPGGGRTWEAMWAGPGDDDYARAIAVDAQGSAYVVGAANTFTTGQDAVVLRLTVAGSVKWSKMYDAAAGLSDWGATLMLRGNYVYLMGVSTRAGGRFSFLAAKYGRTAGGLKWARVSDVAGDVDTTAGVWVDGDGNVTVGGDLAVTGPELKRGAVVSWNRYGVFRWSKTWWARATDEPASFSAITGNSTGDLYLAGWMGRGTARDSVVVKYHKDGSRVWARPFNSDPYESAVAGCLLLTGGSSGGLHAGGTLSVGGLSYSALILKYRP